MEKQRSKNGGNKFDGGKPMVDLVPPEAILGMAEILTYGANKYEAHNWAKGMDWSRVYAALQRHLLAWQQGIDIDDESGMSHLHHAITNVAFLIAYSQRGTGNDDRYKTVKEK